MPKISNCVLVFSMAVICLLTACSPDPARETLEQLGKRTEEIVKAEHDSQTIWKLEELESFISEWHEYGRRPNQPEGAISQADAQWQAFGTVDPDKEQAPYAFVWRLEFLKKAKVRNLGSHAAIAAVSDGSTTAWFSLYRTELGMKIVALSKDAQSAVAQVLAYPGWKEQHSLFDLRQRCALRYLVRDAASVKIQGISLADQSRHADLPVLNVLVENTSHRPLTAFSGVFLVRNQDGKAIYANPISAHLAYPLPSSETAELKLALKPKPFAALDAGTRKDADIYAYVALQAARSGKYPLELSVLARDGANTPKRISELLHQMVERQSDDGKFQDFALLGNPDGTCSYLGEPLLPWSAPEYTGEAFIRNQQQERKRLMEERERIAEALRVRMKREMERAGLQLLSVSGKGKRAILEIGVTNTGDQVLNEVGVRIRATREGEQIGIFSATLFQNLQPGSSRVLKAHVHGGQDLVGDIAYELNVASVRYGGKRFDLHGGNVLGRVERMLLQ